MEARRARRSGGTAEVVGEVEAGAPAAGGVATAARSARAGPARVGFQDPMLAAYCVARVADWEM
jgi:hypothetical protein